MQSVPNIFSASRRSAVRQRALALQSRASEPAKWLGAAMIDDTQDRLDFMQLEPTRALVLGPMADTLALPASCEDCSRLEHMDQAQPIAGAPYDLIVSLGQLDTVNDLPGALLHACNALSEGGVFIAQMLGAGTLGILRDLLLEADRDRPAARIHPQVDNRAATGLLQRAGFSKQVVDQYPLSVSYTKLGTFIRDLREQGLTNQLSDPPPPLSREAWKRAEEAFGALKDAQGRVTESFEILALTGWR